MKRIKYPIHDDFKKWANTHPPLNKPILRLIQTFVGGLYKKQKSTPACKVEKRFIPISDGAKIPALLYTPNGVEKSAPCLIFYPGGGFVLPPARYHFDLAREYAQRVGCKVLFVLYRLAPKYRFPTAHNDAFDAYKWVLENAEKLQIDGGRVALSGESAGGNLAISVCLKAEELGLRMPCAQMLTYPVTGENLETESMQRFVDTPMCSTKDMEKYQKLYAPLLPSDKRKYLLPIEAESLSFLPCTYIETAEFDCLRDGGILFAERLKKEGVDVQLNETRGTMHAFDIAQKSAITRACIEKRIAFLKKCFFVEKS